MDLSALIFVALAVAWAVYLIPKALRHHDEVVRSRSVERFSATMRVLARREPISRRDARLVVTPGRQPSATTVETKSSSIPQPRSYAARRAAAARATRRRRNVLGAILLVVAVVAGLAIADLVTWPVMGGPVALLVTWLVACRVMVKGERAAARPAPAVTPLADELAGEPAGETAGGLPELADSPLTLDVDATLDPAAPAAVPDGAVPAASATSTEDTAPVRAEGAWDMVPTTLPTYVSKPAAARRTVQTIDLDSTGVWSSGRNDDDSALAREAEESERTERTAREAAERRAFGS